jgi:hypothetical protein
MSLFIAYPPELMMLRPPQFWADRQDHLDLPGFSHVVPRDLAGTIRVRFSIVITPGKYQIL